MAGTRGDMVTRIITEMVRPDLSSQAVTAINTAIEAYQSDRFRFSDVDPNNPPTWNTVQGRWAYDSTDNAAISSLFMFDYLLCTVGSTVMAMARRTPLEIHLLLQQNQESGQPTDWAYEGNKIIIYPNPSEAWALTLGGHLRVAAPADDAEVGNPWMLDGERLIRCRAKYELYTHVLRNAAMAAAMSPDADGNNGKMGETYRAWRDLKGIGNKITGTGRIRAMRF